MIPKGWSFEQGLDLIKRAGFDGVELWLGETPWFQMSTTDSEVEGLRRKVESAGLTVSSISTGLHWRYALSTPDPKIRDRGIQIAERRFATAQLCRTDAVLVVAGSLRRKPPTTTYTSGPRIAERTGAQGRERKRRNRSREQQ